MGLLLLILLVLVLFGSIPVWPHSRARGYRPSWGYRPSGILGVVLLVAAIVLFTGSI
jgi:hypothetical protein